MKIEAYAAHRAGGRLEPFSYTAGEVGPWDVRVRISHCGICHSDVHLIDNDWQMTGYPLVPGHEIVGTIEEVGASVRHLEVGQRVGIGWQRSSCMTCRECSEGRENLCSSNQATCVGNHGGFADAIVSDSRFAFPIPEGLDSENAAPLLCAGATVYSPFRNYRVKPSMKVGVIGIGGLGHLALQFARAMGCEVTAFSSSPDKAGEAERFGANHFYPSADSKGLERLAGRYDFLLATVFAPLDWPAFLNLLRPGGNLCFVGAVAEPIPVPVFPLVIGERQITGSVIGSRASIAEMLEFSARHRIQARTERMPFEEVNSAVNRVRESRARYRVVLAN